MEPLRPIYFDLETTGTQPDVDRIIEIAAYDPVRREQFQSFVRPGGKIPQEASAINGITDEMVKDADPFSGVGQKFIEFCSGAVVLVAHNGEFFDLPFLRAEFSRHSLTFPSGWSLVDSLKWARKYRRDLPKHSLQYLRAVFGIPANTAHRALDDVLILHRVFSLMTDDLSPEEIMERVECVREIAPKAKAPCAVLDLF